eukprot:351569-Pelagomonas_calceolata.AAC.1
MVNAVIYDKHDAAEGASSPVASGAPQGASQIWRMLLCISSAPIAAYSYGIRAGWGINGRSRPGGPANSCSSIIFGR